MSHVFFEDFSWASRSEDISTFSLLLSRFVFAAGSGTLLGGEGGATTIAVDDSSSILFDIDGANWWLLAPRWYVDYHSCSKMSIEARFALKDRANTEVCLGFSRPDETGDINWLSFGYGMSESAADANDFRLEGYNNKFGNDVGKTQNEFNAWRVELNFSPVGDIADIKLYKDDVLQDTLSTVSELAWSSLSPVFTVKGAAAGDDFFLDYIKVWAS